MYSEITGTTKLIALLGSPVSHSISPLVHNEAFQIKKLNNVYLCFDVNKEQLKTAVEGLKNLGAIGFNLTMPHKVAILDYLDDISPEADLIGAVNTVLIQNGKLIGYNTDGYGFFASVKEKKSLDTIKKMTVLGAGGAAFSICTEAALLGIKEIQIYSRTGLSLDSIKNLGEKLEKQTRCLISVSSIENTDSLNHSISCSDLLVNTTPVGMEPKKNLSPINDFTCFHPNLFVSDIIYNPLETVFLKKASEVGCETMNGSLMLLYQGEKSFELWTGEKMPIFEIKEKFFIQ